MKNNNDFLQNLAQNSISKTVSDKMQDAMNLGIAEGFCRNGDIEDGLKLYKIIQEKNKTLSNKNVINDIRNLASVLFKEKKYTNALIQYKRLLSFTELLPQEYFYIAFCLAELGQNEFVLDFLKIYEELSSDKLKALGDISEILGLKLKMYDEGILYLEKYISICTENALAFNTLGHFYSRLGEDSFLEKQLKLFSKAHELNPNNPIYIRNIIMVCEKLDKLDCAEKYYKKLMKLNPKHSDKYDYGCLLLRKGELSKGYELMQNRFFAPEIIVKYPSWLDKEKRLKSLNGLSDKTVLLFHEAGYGDSFMYVRFVEEFKKYVKKVILFVPQRMISLFKSSNIAEEIYPMTEDLSSFDYDFNASFVDLPFLLSIEKDSIIKTDGYLKVSEKKVEEFKNKYLKNSKTFKIGISYCMNPKYNNLTGRDIPLECFYPLTKILGVEIFSLQVKDPKNQINNLPQNIKIVDLAKHFKDFEDTAAAIKNMDLIITTDNVILNLAGALNVKTFALFNRFYDPRWFNLQGENVIWYDSVKPYRASSFNGWDDLIKNVIKDLQPLVD